MMDPQLKKDMDQLFSTLFNNTLNDLNQLLPPVTATKQYRLELESELHKFYASILKRLEQEFKD